MNSVSNNYRPPTHFSIFPPGVKNLIIITVLAFLASRAPVIGPYLREYGPLYPIHSPHFYPWQFVTYLFLHASIGHIFFNLFVLWMFGQAVENYWGTKRFLIYFFLCGIGGGLAYVLINNDPVFIRQGSHIVSEYIPTIGDSGAGYGILVAFGMLFPNRLIYLWFIIPVKAKYLVAFFIALQLYYGFSGSELGIAHWAHIGGAVVGFILVMLWRIKKEQTPY